MKDFKIFKRAIKQLIAVTLIGIGGLCGLSLLVGLREPEYRKVPSIIALDFCAASLLPILLGVVLLRGRNSEPRQDACPKCGSAESRPTLHLRRPRRSLLWLHAGLDGWLISALWRASRKTQVRCAQCESLYHVKTSGSQTAAAVLWFICLECVLGLIRAILA